jgi:hypothetical protein
MRRPHDAPHTVTTVLLVLGVSERTVMQTMGWGNDSDGRSLPARHRTRFGGRSPLASTACCGRPSRSSETETETTGLSAARPPDGSGSVCPGGSWGGGI